MTSPDRPVGAAAADHYAAVARDRRLARRIALSRLALAVERLWAWLWLPVGVVGLFLLVSLAGLWPLLSPTLHAVVLGLFGLAFIAGLVPLLRLEWPSREEGLARLERLAGVPHRPASSYRDEMGPAGASPATGRLWQAHRRRLEALVERLRARWPRPRMEHRDPLALRALLVLGVGLLAVFGGDAFWDRLGSAFRIGLVPGQALTRLDAWVAPPAYTGRQPRLLTDGSRALAADQQTSQLLEVPEGSTLIVRAVGEAHANFKLMGQGADGAPAPVPPEAQGDGQGTVSEFRLVLEASQTVRVVDSGLERLSWQFQVVEDRPPEITLTREPGQTPRGSLSLGYRVKDDYGVVGAEARFALAEGVETKALDLGDGTVIAPMGEPPTGPLKLPTGSGRKDGTGKTTLDLTAHIWAGLATRMVLSARDQAGKVGETGPIPVTLPERPFDNPLARALVEQRRKLALTPARYRDVAMALEALTLAPDRFPVDPAVYLGLRSAYWRLQGPPTAEAFRTTVEQLWSLALKVESGNLSDAEQALKAAEERLMKALEEGASDAEIQRLMQELKQAMNEFLRSLAEQGERNPGDQADRQQGDQQLSQRDLEDMLKRMEEMSRSGNKDAAQQMLSELKDLLDRLQSGRMANSGRNGQSKAMEELGDMIMKQRKLLDDTFKAGRERRSGSGKNGEGGESQNGGGDQGEREWGSAGDLGRRQQDLRRQLEQMMQSLQDLGPDSQQQMNGAGQAMQDAEQSLQEEDLDSAAEQQTQALDQLRKGAQAMTEQMMKGRNGQMGAHGGNQDHDPFGRAWRSDSEEADGSSTKVPRDIDVQRAREILDELRRRVGETTRPPAELDYLERLLRSTQ